MHSEHVLVDEPEADEGLGGADAAGDKDVMELDVVDRREPAETRAAECE